MSQRESAPKITPQTKFRQNLRCRVYFRYFFGRSVMERPSYKSLRDLRSLLRSADDRQAIFDPSRQIVAHPKESCRVRWRQNTRTDVDIHFQNRFDLQTSLLHCFTELAVGGIILPTFDLAHQAVAHPEEPCRVWRRQDTPTDGNLLFQHWFDV